ncbi:MATE family efflux transporter [Spirochaeta isovalerica]|uniref:Putative MATE family efflux protein n=1 Tax=Spirochaeta isovalerica TaxID=150 RepID=A0A841R5Z6_9SPIO|nr:MATE family efflux transporter [Spirochaeta isovalerica]MBB6478577.1 putative MATE family efflux protein [Spirochaeta isovalerica]
MKYLNQLLSEVVKDKLFFRSMLSIALPLALQNLIQSGLNMIDTLMIGRLGETEIAAVALSNQVFFLLVLILFGITSGASVFASQYWGSRDIKGLRESLSLSLLLAGGAGLLFTSGAVFFPRFILSIYSKDPEVIRLGSSYLRIVGMSYLATSVTFSYAASLRSTGRVKLTTAVSGISIAINTGLNFLLIFGIGPFPALGVRGAAIATVIARAAETIVLITFIYRNRYPSALSLDDLLHISRAYIRKYFQTSIPVILNEIFWSFGITAINLVFARISTEAMASFSISDTISKLFMIFFFGTSGACAVMVGNRIGAGEESRAVYYAHAYAILAPALGLLMGIILFPLSSLLPLLFNISADAKAGVTSILRVLAFFMPFKIFNWHMIVGILRSGGDTRYSLYMEAGGIWLIAVPAAVLTGLVFHLPLMVIYAALSVEEIVKFTFGFSRLKSGKWLKNVIS